MMADKGEQVEDMSRCDSMAPETLQDEMLATCKSSVESE